MLHWQISLNIGSNANCTPECERLTGQALTLRHHAGYDHSYWFIQRIVHDHIEHHAAALHG